MTFIARTSAAVFQSPSRGETVAVRHQPLRRDAGQLGQTVQILKRRGEALEIPARQKCAQPDFDARGFADRFVSLAAFFQIAGDFVGRFVFLAQRVHFLFRGFVDELDQIADAVAVDGVTEFHLRGNLVAFGHGHFAHVVAEAAELRGLPVGPRRRRARPRAELFLRGLFLPEPDDHLAVQPHPAPDEAVLAVAVRGLVHVHEIHVNARPRNVAIVLRVQMRDRLAELLEAVDPHLRRRESVAPVDETDALGRVVRATGTAR